MAALMLNGSRIFSCTSNFLGSTPTLLRGVSGRVGLKGTAGHPPISFDGTSRGIKTPLVIASHLSTSMVPSTTDIMKAVKIALDEDLGDRGDVTSAATIPAQTLAQATFLSKAEGVLAGLSVAEAVFKEVDPDLMVEWSAQDGKSITKGQTFGVVTGSACSILTAERVALNFLQRMSGIATLTQSMAQAAKPARILDTRKTVPGLRLLDKWAVVIGGGENHRIGLYDMILIKDNHIASVGGIRAAVEAAQTYVEEQGLGDMEIEVETRTLDEVAEVLSCCSESTHSKKNGIDGSEGKRKGGRVTRIMLDNMVRVGRGEDGRLEAVDVSMLKEAVGMVGGRVDTEASGNVTLDTLPYIATTGVTFVSSGTLTHSVTALDISLNIDTDLAVAVNERSVLEVTN